MTEQEAIHRALQTEQRMLARQQLLKRLWKLAQTEPPDSDSLSEASDERVELASVETLPKQPDVAPSVFAGTPPDA